MTRAILAAAGLVAAFSAPAFDLEGHRGTRGLAPENTLAAFRRALAIGVTTLETDLAVTRDDVLVISHDPLLNPDIVRGPDGKWIATKGPPIHSLTLAELSRYDIGRVDPASSYATQFPHQQPADGERFPTLAQLFVLVRESGKPVRLNLETKIDPTHPDNTVDAATFAKLVIDAVRDAGLMDRATLQSFDWRTLVEAKKLAFALRTACLTTENNDNTRPAGDGPSPWTAGLDARKFDGSAPRLAHAAGCAIWSPFWRNATPERIAEAHALKLEVLPWTVNDPADMARLIDAGVDGLITDYPDRAREV
ncbi:MAG TPA: glycerophosphodiester phosphodiesterase, partial [Casimicrobiaceae bacterium]|nr:glycerophosphodiester phosphodiesterase [Casimicrobiaceae bacterium]